MSINTPVPRTHPYPVHQTHTPTPEQQTPARKRLNDGCCVSLAVPIEMEDNSSLLETLQMLTVRTLREKHPQADALRQACNAILTLDQYDHVADHDEPTCQLAAKLLLELRQPHLLQRLAAVTGQRFVLDVGTNSSHADVLARIGDAWPKNVPVALVLDTRLPSDALDALSTFLRCTGKLGVQVHAQHGTSSSNSASAFAQALKACSLVELSIVSGASSVGVLQAMVGVQAETVSVLAERAHGEEPAQGTALHDALTALVRHSGAGMLNIAGDSDLGTVSEDLAAKLLDCRVYWIGVQLRPGLREGKLMQLLLAGKHKIGELHVVGKAGEFSMQGLVEGACRNGVHTLRFLHDADVVSLADCLHRRLMMSVGGAPHVFERISACLTYKAAEQERAALAVNAILANPVLITLEHRAGGAAGEGRVAIGPLLAAAIEGAGTSSRLVPMSERVPRVVSAQKRMFELNFTLTSFMAEDRPLADLIGFLRSPTDALIPASAPVVPTGNADLVEQKIRVLNTSLVDKRFVRGVITFFLFKLPEHMLFVCQVLARAGFPKQDLPAEEWKALGNRYLERSARNASSSLPLNRQASEELALLTAALLRAADRPSPLGSAQTLPPTTPTVVSILTHLASSMDEALLLAGFGSALALCERGHAQLVEGLAFAGVVPADVWLEVGLGIDTKPAGRGS